MKNIFCDIKHGLTTTSEEQLAVQYLFMASNTLYQEEIFEAMATKFSNHFAMLKKHRKFCGRSLTHLDATLVFKESLRDLWATL